MELALLNENFSLGFDNSFKSPIIIHGWFLVLGKLDICFIIVFVNVGGITINKSPYPEKFRILSWIKPCINLLLVDIILREESFKDSW